MFDTKYPSGKRNKRRKKILREKGSITRMPMSRFKIFGVYQMLTISQFSRGGVREIWLRTKTILPGVRKGNFAT